MSADTADVALDIAALERPFEDDGYVLAGESLPPAPAEMVGRVLTTVTNHLERTCWWPKEEQGAGWQLGDYSFYILEFAVSDGVFLYAQVWSEPGENVLVEVASGAWNPPADQFVTDTVREALLNRGFEQGGQAKNYRKVVSLNRRTDCRKLARELMGVITECLGYDGRSPLNYKLHLGQRTRPARVFESLTFDDFGRFLRAGGFSIEPIDEDNREAYRVTGEPRFVAALKCESDENKGHFAGFTLSVFARLAPAVLLAVEQELKDSIPFTQVFIDSDGDLCIRQNVYVGGGVTEAYLRHMLGFWRTAMSHANKVIDKHGDTADERVLN